MGCVDEGFWQFIINDKEEFWVSTTSSGLIRISKKDTLTDYHYFTEKNSLPNNKISTLFADRENNLWAATQGKIVQCNLNTFEFI